MELRGIPARFRLKEQRLSLAQQACMLKQRYPESICRIRNESLYCRIDGFRACDCSRRYSLEIIKDPGRPVEVWLSGDTLYKRADLKTIPHIYDSDEAKHKVLLCLSYKDWRPSQAYTDTFLPWAMEWIFYFEVWLYTGEWSGGGKHPQQSQAKANKFKRPASAQLVNPLHTIHANDTRPRQTYSITRE